MTHIETHLLTKARGPRFTSPDEIVIQDCATRDAAAISAHWGNHLSGTTCLTHTLSSKVAKNAAKHSGSPTRRSKRKANEAA